MSLRTLALMTDEQRAERREFDEAAYHRVHAYTGQGETRSRAITSAAKALGMARNDLIAAYWRHVRRSS